MENPTPSSSSPSPSKAQQQEDAARQNLHRSIARLDAMLAVLEGTAQTGFRRLEPGVQAQYISMCADLARQSQASWLELETLRIMRSVGQ